MRGGGVGGARASRAAGGSAVRLGVAALLGLAGGVALMGDAEAQEFRGRLLTTGRYVQVRPLDLDSVALDATVEVDGRRQFEGRPVACVGATCTYYRSADPEHAVVLTQDLSFTAWGLGMEGLSATALLRGRADVGGAFQWPRSDDPFDAILAYAELARERWRVRVGRQRTLSGLGFSGFDGVDARVQALSWLRVEGYGGRSLARGLEEPLHEALQAIEDFVPDQDAWLVGAAAEAQGPAASAVGVRYQREILSSRGALISERASVDTRTGLLRPLGVQAALDWDVAFDRIGKAHLTLQLPLQQGRMVLEATARRYLPYFELWTIWGFFSPVAYHEAELQARWTPRPGATVWASGARRAYEDADAPIIFSKLTDDATRFSAGARVRLPGALTAEGSYRLENGFGAYLGSGDAGVSWRPHEALSVGVRGSAFQQIMEFRVGEGVVLGAGAFVNAELTRRIRLAGGMDIYRQAFENRPAAEDWNQTRGWASVEITFGDDPGLAGRSR
ncbi:MAG TPA: hypothetical protein VMK65_04730 [Longimicrobiales bacterium]|nr:hypothetical protein [Longimicrobiales bacterium]